MHVDSKDIHRVALLVRCAVLLQELGNHEAALEIMRNAQTAISLLDVDPKLSQARQHTSEVRQ